MKSEEQTTYSQNLKLPNRLFLFSLAIGLLTPFIARLPGVPVHGWEWLTDYFFGIGGLAFFSAFNLIPSGTWYAIGKWSKRTPLAFWVAVSGGVGFLLWAHGSLNLRSSSTASIALVFFPIYAVGAILAGWTLGLLAHAIIKAERMRVWLIWIIGSVAVVFGAGIPLQESLSIVEMESRFPFTAVANIPLEKRQVYSSDFMGEVKVLALGDFDNIPGNEIAALGDSSIAKLQPETYTVQSKTEFKREGCDRCTHMYPYLASDGKGSILVSTSDGVSDINGHLIWVWNARGFSRVVPIQASTPEPAFFVYEHVDHVALHNAAGKMLWKNDLPVLDIGLYETPEGEQFPFAVTEDRKSCMLKIFNQEGTLNKNLKLPEWASNVETVAWPRRGHLLVGYGSYLGVLDPNGQEVLKHVIKDTSFNPYHGPNGTAVKFNPTEEPYLAVLSHGSSGYDRSVLLIFDPKGNLVWQEELKKLSTIIAVPKDNGTCESLLVGGIDGIIEFRLANSSSVAR